MNHFQCTRCGDCCKNVDTATLVGDDDLMRWVAEGRRDLLDFRDDTGRLWYDPTPKPRGCPHLRQESNGMHTCSIHETKPIRCRNFPDVEVSKGKLISVDKWAAQHCPGVAAMKV
ncbi:MAG: YkgJ family cysteine cluster protein [Planctomycetota bacterium]|nr:YkgJ family cysteine cluster protein [Planctomycetota bacterium]MDA1138435.1 YkgJ family cysteine cluster protein [Planctomycetota bacterium]